MGDGGNETGRRCRRDTADSIVSIFCFPFSYVLSSVSFCRPTMASSQQLLKTFLYDFHASFGAKFVPFAGYLMPVVYSDLGISQSVLHTRQSASLFDVSHMGQLRLTGSDRERFIESLTVANVKGLKEQQACLSVFLNEEGGIMDDTIITKQGNSIDLVVNAACKEKDVAHIRRKIESFDGDVKLEVRDHLSLVAVQGPQAHEVLKSVLPGALDLSRVSFMHSFTTKVRALDDLPISVARLGYTGEDGFEISIPNEKVETFTQLLMQDARCKLAGLGARDVLRLEAGLCLYGHDMDEMTNPLEANLGWLLGKRRREERNFPGAARILSSDPLKRLRVGLVVEGAPAREGAPIVGLGKVTSGSPSPCLKKNIAMGYVPVEFSKPGTKVQVQVREKTYDAVIAEMPFVPSKYYRAPK